MLVGVINAYNHGNRPQKMGDDHGYIMFYYILIYLIYNMIYIYTYYFILLLFDIRLYYIIIYYFTSLYYILFTMIYFIIF